MGRISAGFLFCLSFIFFAKNTYAVSINSIQPQSSSTKQFEKYEVRFSVSTNAKYKFFEYDTAPPPGVTPGTGITVQALITSPSGKTLTQPAFFQNETRKVSSGDGMYFEETGNSYWTLRFSPQEIGTYQVQLKAADSSGTTTVQVGSFSATAGTKPGFIRVSKSDPRYFEFSNGQLYWPMGPAYVENGGKSTSTSARNYDTSQYAGTGINFYRPWMAGDGVYSTNWARWIRNDAPSTNEGFPSALTWTEHAPGSELSYELDSSRNALYYWLPRWGQDKYAFRLKNTCYKASLTYKTTNLSGSVNFKPWSGWPGFKDSQSSMTSTLNSQPNVIGPITGSNDGWRTVTANFTGNTNFDNIFIYLAAGSGGKINIDEFSVREIIPNKDCSQVSGTESLGAEIIRASKADLHTYTDDRGAAFFDWLLTEGEQYGVYYKLVVFDKNDWITNHIDYNTGQWSSAPITWPYYAPENTKNRWLVRQWYRYLAARWGYSTAVYSWEFNNEGPPSDQNNPPGSGYSGHWGATQAFGAYMHTIDTHPHLITTSFNCCWKPQFWGDKAQFPDIDYADIHEYSGNSELNGNVNYINDPISGMVTISNIINTSNVGKPTNFGEFGLSDNSNPFGPSGAGFLNTPNDGTWWRQIQWATALHIAGISNSNYWFFEHLRNINREAISTVLKNYLTGVEWNKGGYTDAQASSSVRVVGKKNLSTGVATLWAQNNGSSTNISLTVKPSTSYNLELWDTRNGNITRQTLSSDSSGRISFNTPAIPDTGIKLIPSGYTPPTSPPNTPLPAPQKPDPNGDGQTNISDLMFLLVNYAKQFLAVNQDINNDTKINIIDFAITLNAITNP